VVKLIVIHPVRQSFRHEMFAHLLAVQHNLYVQNVVQHCSRELGTI